MATTTQKQYVAGKATYKGRAYYVAGRVLRGGRTKWDYDVAAVMSRDQTRILLYFRDGSRQFWASRADVTVSKYYMTPQTIRGLARFAREARDGFPGRDTCPNCGSPSCSGTRGDRCEED